MTRTSKGEKRPVKRETRTETRKGANRRERNETGPSKDEERDGEGGDEDGKGQEDTVGRKVDRTRARDGLCARRGEDET